MNKSENMEEFAFVKSLLTSLNFAIRERELLFEVLECSSSSPFVRGLARPSCSSSRYEYMPICSAFSFLFYGRIKKGIVPYWPTTLLVVFQATQQ